MCAGDANISYNMPYALGERRMPQSHTDDDAVRLMPYGATRADTVRLMQYVATVALTVRLKLTG